MSEITRLEKRAAVSPSCEETGILQTCLCLRMQANGSSDPWSQETVAEAVAFLRCVLATWEPTVSKRGRHFDSAVRLMVVATLEEVTAIPSDVIGKTP